MSSLATASCFLTFCSSDQFLLLYKFKIFVLNNSLFASYITLCINIYDYMHGYNTVEAQIYYPRYIYKEVASITGANYCPDAYSLIMLVVRCLLTIMFTQRRRCIGRLQLEKCVSLFVQT